VALADEDDPATSTATGGKENVSTSVPPAVMPENRAGKQHSDPEAMQKEAQRQTEQIRKEEDERGQP